jgi:hypothetical protein
MLVEHGYNIAFANSLAEVGSDGCYAARHLCADGARLVCLQLTSDGNRAFDRPGFGNGDTDDDGIWSFGSFNPGCPAVAAASGEQRYEQYYNNNANHSI